MLSLLEAALLLLLIPIALIILRAAASTATVAAAANATATPGTAAWSLIATLRLLAKILVVASTFAFASPSPRIARERHPPTPGGRRVPRAGFVPNDAGWSHRCCWFGRSRSSGSRTTTMTIGMRRGRWWWHSGCGRHGEDAGQCDVGEERRRAGIDRVDGHRDAAGHGVVTCGRLGLNR